MNPGSGEYLEIDGIRTYFVRRGQGPAIVLFHGKPAGASVHVMWEPQLDYFVNAGYTVCAFDSVGFGRTGNDGDFFRPRRLAHARAFLEAMDLERYTLWGFSDGSWMSSHLALDDPKVERLILQASGNMTPRVTGDDPEQSRLDAAERDSYTPSLTNARAYLQHHLVNQAAITDELVAELYSMSIGPNEESFQRRTEEPSSRTDFDALGKITVPRLILWGRDDSHGTGPQRALRLFEKLPGAELHLFYDCGHWVNVDQATRVNSLVLDFMRST